MDHTREVTEEEEAKAAAKQKAEAEAGRLGLEMSEYVELALDGFKHDAAK